MDERKSTMPGKASTVQEKPPLYATNSNTPSPQPAPPAPAAAARSPAHPVFTKVAPNDLYRWLLPAALFLLTFVTVMTLLLMYMDTTALRAQQFRMNMTHDYDLRSIAQDDPSLVAYVRQLHLGRGGQHDETPAHSEPPQERVLALALATNNKYNGTYVEILVGGGRDAGAAWLERARGWRGLVVRADPRDYFTVRAAASRRALTLHACLSPVSHPKEVTYYESAGTWRHDGVSVDALGSEAAGAGFSSRVLCFPLYTMLLVGNATKCDYLLLSSPGAHRALQTLPFDRVDIQLLEVRMPADFHRNSTTTFLRSKGYQIRMEHDDSVLYEMIGGAGAKV